MTKLTPFQLALLNAALSDEGAAGADFAKRSVSSLAKRGWITVSAERDRIILTVAGRNALSASIAHLPSGGADAGKTTKLALLVSLMQRPEGADLQSMMQASGWQAHSVRGAISGVIKKRLHFEVSTERGATGLNYRIAEAQE